MPTATFQIGNVGSQLNLIDDSKRLPRERSLLQQMILDDHSQEHWSSRDHNGTVWRTVAVSNENLTDALQLKMT